MEEDLEEIVKNNFFEKIEEKNDLFFILNDSVVIQAKKSLVMQELARRKDEVAMEQEEVQENDG